MYSATRCVRSRAVSIADDGGSQRRRSSAAVRSPSRWSSTSQRSTRRSPPASISRRIDGVVVFRSYLTDFSDDAGKKLKPGRNAIRCSIPAGLLNSGRYLINLRIGLHWIKWIVYSDDVLQFDVIADHGESLFLNDQARPGVVAPILQWDVIEPSSGQDSVEAPKRLAASS